MQTKKNTSIFHFSLGFKFNILVNNSIKFLTIFIILLFFFFRESYMLSMFEMMMSTMETKLRRVENLDRAIQVLMRKMDGIENSLKVRVKKSDFHLLSDKIDKIEAMMSKNENHDDDEEVLSVSSSNRVNSKLSLQEVMTSTVTSAVEDMKALVHGMDRKLGHHINLVSENLGRMNNMVEDVHDAVIPTPTSSNKTSKLDELMNRIDPLLGVSESMKEMKGMMKGTKNSVDGLVPKSEELLSQTHRQERAISNIHSDLNEKTNKIILELTQVERELLIAKENIDNIEKKGKRDKMDKSDLEFITVAQPFQASETTTVINFEDETDVEEPSKKPSVVFPSIYNKPIFNNNTTFLSYDTKIINKIKGQNKKVKGFSCADIYDQGFRENGIYYLQIGGGVKFWYLKVYCDMETSGGGWTVIQRRDNLGIPRENFNQDWNNYKHGFGKVDREFWLGNENIYMLTNYEDYEIRIDLQDFDGSSRYAEYKTFKINSEKDLYRLEIGGYQGNAGDSMNDPWYGANQRPFSTYDR